MRYTKGIWMLGLLAVGCATARPPQTTPVPATLPQPVAAATCDAPPEQAAPARPAPIMTTRMLDVPSEFLHFTAPKVRKGMTAPDFALPLPDGAGQASLSMFRDKPTVLVFGSITCDRFRGSAGEVVALYNDFSGAANFLMVYIREAHATDEWIREVNESVGIRVKQPVSQDERAGVARTCVNRLKLPFTTVVDDIDDTISETYGAWPERLYVIGTDGRIVYQGGQGPSGFRPAEVRALLLSTYGATADAAR